MCHTPSLAEDHGEGKTIRRSKDFLYYYGDCCRGIASATIEKEWPPRKLTIHSTDQALIELKHKNLMMSSSL